MEVIYDFETLSQNPLNGVVVSIAGIEYEEERFLTNPYTFDELLDMVKSIKFDVKDQIKYGRKIEKGSLDWWKGQAKEVRDLIHPSADDVSISELHPFLRDELNLANADKIFTRGNSFDPVFTKSILYELGLKDPTPWWNIRDVRSYIEGFSFGTDIRHDFIPNELVEVFTPHDPAHDVAMDVIRMQYLIRTIYE